MRQTRQRRAITAALERAKRPLSPSEIVSYAQDEVAGINLATVYRNLKAMTEGGALTAVVCMGQPARYELAGLDHHHHFLCEVCDRLFDLEGCVEGLTERLAPVGFRVRRHEVQLTGTCKDCG